MTEQPAIRPFLDPTPDLNGASILITGGTGSFGNGYTKIILRRYQPKRLVIFSRDEMKQSEMAHEFPIDKYPSIRYFIGDVRDHDRLEIALRGIDTIIHAAALKQCQWWRSNTVSYI